MSAAAVSASAAALALLGLLTIGVTSTMTALGQLAWDRSAEIGGIGFAGFVAWLVVLGSSRSRGAGRRRGSRGSASRRRPSW